MLIAIQFSAGVGRLSTKLTSLAERTNEKQTSGILSRERAGTCGQGLLFRCKGFTAVELAATYSLGMLHVTDCE